VIDVPDFDACFFPCALCASVLKKACHNSNSENNDTISTQRHGDTEGTEKYPDLADEAVLKSPKILGNLPETALL